MLGRWLDKYLGGWIMVSIKDHAVSNRPGLGRPTVFVYMTKKKMITRGS